MNDLVAGQIDQVCDLAPTVVPQIQAGTIRGIAIAQPERSAVTPDVATAGEGGVPDYIFNGWNAVFAPMGTRKAAIDRRDAALRAALADETVRKRIADLGSLPPKPDEQGPEALRRLVAGDVEKWGKVIQAAGISAQ